MVKKRQPITKWMVMKELGRWAVPVLTALLLSVFLVPALTAMFSDENPIRNLINQEVDLSLNGNVKQVVSLYSSDAYVRDAAGGNTSLEVIWNGENAITQRYEDLPTFAYLRHDAIEITISSDKSYARAIADTIGAYKVNGADVTITSNHGEKWTFEKVNGTWKIASFTYNLP
jgi:hypothetical protein